MKTGILRILVVCLGILAAASVPGALSAEKQAASPKTKGFVENV